ncbi:MAG TPA: hypothetical protein VFX18_05195 [Candidatus Nitrosocosmicus sp.]|nr:hypothetical protein [Candidatus Nitrosocosmicus sp.]
MKKSKYSIILFSIFVLLSLTLIIVFASSSTNLLFSQAQSITNNITENNTKDNQKFVFDSDSKPSGISYAEWTSKWWQWAYSVPKNINPAYDNTGKYCSESQSGPVWFLTSAYKHPVDRFCSIPSGKSILLTILNSECSFAEFPNLKNENQLRQCAKQMQDSVVSLQASINGINILGLDKFRIQSPLFNFTLPKNNILGLPSQTTSAVSDGNWVFLKPLPIGNYIISFKGGLKNISSIVENKPDNFTFAGPYGWDNKVNYYIDIVK